MVCPQLHRARRCGNDDAGGLNEETALRKVEAEYKASRPGYLVFLVDGYDDVFGDMLDSERARLLEGINRVLEDMIGRGTGFLRRVASGRYMRKIPNRKGRMTMKVILKQDVKGHGKRGNW